MDKLVLAKSTPATSPVVMDDASGNHADNQRLLDETEKQLHQRIVAKLNHLAHDRLDLRNATSFLAGAASAPNLGDLQAAKRVQRYLIKVPVAWQGFPACDPRPGVVRCSADADWASDKVSWRSTSGSVVTLGGGVLSCWAKKQRSVALRSWESELFSAITASTRSLGIQNELKDLESSCTVVVASDSQSVIHHPQRRGHIVASKHVG